MSYPDNLRAERLGVVQILRTSIRQIRSLLQNSGRLLWPNGAPPKENVAKGHVIIDNVESGRDKIEFD